mmetsp:Transcript_96037/g.275767  ORF Transcript_96037/g.275767 Transcript_96037/m.275767 type:complete len:250 (+) Transcript_96037:294-1043(+)
MSISTRLLSLALSFATLAVATVIVTIVLLSDFVAALFSRTLAFATIATATVIIRIVIISSVVAALSLPALASAALAFAAFVITGILNRVGHQIQHAGGACLNCGWCARNLKRSTVCMSVQMDPLDSRNALQVLDVSTTTGQKHVDALPGHLNLLHLIIRFGSGEDTREAAHVVQLPHSFCRGRVVAEELLHLPLGGLALEQLTCPTHLVHDALPSLECAAQSSAQLHGVVYAEELPIRQLLLQMMFWLW